MKIVLLGVLAVVVLAITQFLAEAWWSTSLAGDYRVWMRSHFEAGLEASMDIDLLTTMTVCLTLSTFAAVLSIKACRRILRNHRAGWIQYLTMSTKMATVAQVGGMVLLVLGTGVGFFVCFGTRQFERDSRMMAGLDPGLSWEAEYRLAMFVGLLVSMALVLLFGRARHRCLSARLAKSVRKGGV